MRHSILHLCILLFVCLSCSDGHRTIVKSKSIYIDSVLHRNYERTISPHLISTKSYAFNDSVSEALEAMDSKSLSLLNSTERVYNDPLEYTITDKDTIVVKIIHHVGKDRFPIGNLFVKDDSIFLNVTGCVEKKFPPIGENYRAHVRYFETRYKIKTDDTTKYKIFYSNE
jgi:hypothetical protein